MLDDAFPCVREVLVNLRAFGIRFPLMFLMGGASLQCLAQAMPPTSGETLSGKPVAPADLVHGHDSILVAGFSHDAGMHCGPWMKAIQNDPALKDVASYELAMLEKAPGMFRGMIKSGMRKGTTAEEQNRIVVMTKDQEEWEKFFGVEDEKDPYVVVLNAKGDVVWRGHDPAVRLEPLLKRALDK